MQVCTNLISYTDSQYESLVILSQLPSISCSQICNVSELPIYGRCISELINGDLQINGTKMCVNPFVFNGKQCVCDVGYYLSNAKCYNISMQIDILDQYIYQNNSQLYNKLQGNLSTLELLITNYKIDMENKVDSSIQQLVQDMATISDDLIDQIVIVNVSIASVNQNLTNDLQVLNQDLINTKIIFSSQLNTVNNSLYSLIEQNTIKITDLKIQYNNFINAAILNNSIQQTEISTINSNIQTVSNQLAGINSALSSAVNALNSDLVNYKAYQNGVVAGINNALNNLASYDQYLLQRINDQSATISNLQTTVSSLQSQIDLITIQNVVVSNVVNNCGDPKIQVCGNGICGNFVTSNLEYNYCDPGCSGSCSSD
ncbi:Hypothetical_protein [Hexamita inflata]|uniref:Hypothetical_protein n=1 Tax=Hexamita inflata TaxID=28002 RepID=A0AA86N9R2_9EUKA|nr:Hypothetical protein HINF_LOCUS2644 [Hexamita inflata]CAI9915001.1 Hypothetical protein HINF_LOCUS2646 [Hexamita inflata]